MVSQPLLFPAKSDLQAWADHDWADGVQVADLEQLETLEVVTRNTTYEIIVMDALERQVLVRGGRFFPVYTRATLSGASLWGSFLKVGGIYVGFSMELHADGGPIITSPVREISVVERDVGPT